MINYLTVEFVPMYGGRMETFMTTENKPSDITEDKIPIKKPKKARNRFASLFYFFLIVIVIVLLCMAYMMNNYETNYKGTLVTDEAAKESDSNTSSPSVPADNPYSVYETVPYARDGMFERYVEYSDLNPDMPTEEVVWRTNANLDKPAYGFDIDVTTYDDPLMLINKYYKVNEDYCPDDMVLSDGLLVREETGNMFTKMRDDAALENITLKITSAYISAEEQKAVYDEQLLTDTEKNIDRFCPRPGHSEHHSGMAIDVIGSNGNQENFAQSAEFQWLTANCHKYGFIIRYMDETEEITGFKGNPCHLRYVGTEVSTYMHDNNVKTLEEYLAKK